MSLFSTTPNEVISTNPAITESDLKLFESKLNGTLPLHYRNFLLKFNGGSLKHSEFSVFEKNSIFHFPNPNGFNTIVGIEEFWALEQVVEEFMVRDETIRAIQEMVDCDPKWKAIIIPDDVIVIGNAYLYLLLAFRGEFWGNIYQVHNDNLTFISNNIDELIENCFTTDFDFYKNIEGQLNNAVNSGDLGNFKDIINNQDGFELLSTYSTWLSDIALRLLRPKKYKGEDNIENYKDFLNFLEEKKLITWDLLSKWLKQYDTAHT
jgi:hypothetical protein